jgi:hypothetical protein
VRPSNWTGSGSGATALITRADWLARHDDSDPHGAVFRSCHGERQHPASVPPVSGRKQGIENGYVFSVRQAAAACNVSQPVVRRWLTLGLLPEPPWTLQRLHQVRDLTDPKQRRRGPRAAHGTMARWNAGCSCAACRAMQSDAARERGRARAQTRLPIEVRGQFLSAIYAGQPFRQVLRDLGLTPNQVWGLAKTDDEWSAALEAALTAARRGDLIHGTNAAYVKGCVCWVCREHQQRRQGRNRGY